MDNGQLTTKRKNHLSAHCPLFTAHFLKFLFPVILLFSMVMPAYASPITIEDVEKSDEYLRKKGEIKYTHLSNENLREVFVNGFRVSDQNLISITNNKELIDKANSEITFRRLTGTAIVGVGLPSGVFLIYLASMNDTTSSSTQISNGYQTFDLKTFLFGTLGAVAIIFSIVNSVSLLNDITGLNSPNIFKDNEVEEIIMKYNENLKKEILNKYNNNSSINSLFSFNNNIMILSIKRSF